MAGSVCGQGLETGDLKNGGDIVRDDVVRARDRWQDPSMLGSL